MKNELERFEKFTGIFTRRGVLEFVDTSHEVDEWIERHSDKSSLSDSDAVFEGYYLRSMATMLRNNGIDDPPLLNFDFIGWSCPHQTAQLAAG